MTKKIPNKYSSHIIKEFLVIDIQDENNNNYTGRLTLDKAKSDCSFLVNKNLEWIYEKFKIFNNNLIWTETFLDYVVYLEELDELLRIRVNLYRLKMAWIEKSTKIVLKDDIIDNVNYFISQIENQIEDLDIIKKKKVHAYLDQIKKPFEHLKEEGDVSLKN